MAKIINTDSIRRHRKPAVDADGKQASPRKAIATDGTFGTIF
jgi:hypothetical protein